MFLWMWIVFFEPPPSTFIFLPLACCFVFLQFASVTINVVITAGIPATLPFSFWSCDTVCCRWPGSLSHALKSPFRSNHSRLMLLMTWRGKEITLPFHPAALTASRPQCSPRLDMEDAPKDWNSLDCLFFGSIPFFFFFIPSSDHLALHRSPLYTFTCRCPVSQLYSCICWMMSELNKPDVQFKQRVISHYGFQTYFSDFLLLV